MAIQKKAGQPKKASQPTQRTPQQRILVLKGGRKKVLQWRNW